MYKEKNQAIKEGLQIMLKNQDLFGQYSGLCSWVSKLAYENLIPHETYRLLNMYIEDNRPSRYSSLEAYNSRKDCYYWTRGNIKPRLKWIHKHIKKLSK